MLLVVDANIFIDLFRGGILDALFSGPWQVVATALLRNEMRVPAFSRLLALGLLLQPLTDSQETELYALLVHHRRLAPVDVASLLLARDLHTTLITGDRRLMALAQSRSVPVHGLLWLSDEFVQRQVITPSSAATALVRARDAGARLPEPECRLRLNRWLKQL